MSIIFLKIVPDNVRFGVLHKIAMLLNADFLFILHKMARLQDLPFRAALQVAVSTFPNVWKVYVMPRLFLYSLALMPPNFRLG